MNNLCVFPEAQISGGGANFHLPIGVLKPVNIH